jgi:hypothetical protein
MDDDAVTLYRGNRPDAEWATTTDETARAFKAWRTAAPERLDLRDDLALADFIAHPDGMNSTYDDPTLIRRVLAEYDLIRDDNREFRAMGPWT